MGVQERVWTRQRARAEGVSRERLTRGVEFVRVAPGCYLEACWAADLPSRCAAVQLAAPGAVLSHWTALAVRGLPTPSTLRGASAPIHLTVPAGSARPCWAEVVAHRAAVLRPVTVGGLRMTGAVRAWCDSAALVAGGPPVRRPGARPVPRADLADLVAAGDALLAKQPATSSEIALLLASRPGGRGVGVARQAAQLLDPRAESPQESRLRVVLTLAGLAPPAVQHEVRTRSGAFVARVDLAYPERVLAVEYDGDHHRGRRQWRLDLERRERIEALGWRVLVVTGADLLGRPDVVLARVRAALARSPLVPTAR